MKMRIQKFVLLERPLKALTGEDLHDRLKNMIDSVTSEAIEQNYLADKYKKLNLRKAKTLKASLRYGKRLNHAYEIFKHEKLAGKHRKISWVKWVYIKTGISEKYARQLQKMAYKVYEYPRLRYLPLTVRDLYEIRKNIEDMVKTSEIADYWKNPAKPTRTAPEFLPVFPPP